MEQIERDSSSTSALPLAICMIMSMANIFIETIEDITLNILNLGFSFGYTVIPEFSSCSPRTLNSWLAAFVLVYTLRSAFEFARHLRSRASGTHRGAAPRISDAASIARLSQLVSQPFASLSIVRGKNAGSSSRNLDFDRSRSSSDFDRNLDRSPEASFVSSLSWRGGLAEVLSDDSFFAFGDSYGMPRLRGGMRPPEDAPARGREIPRTPAGRDFLGETPDPRAMREMRRPSSVPAGPTRVRIDTPAVEAEQEEEAEPRRLRLPETPAGGFSPRLAGVERDFRRIIDEQQAEVLRLRRLSEAQQAQSEAQQAQLQQLQGALLASRPGDDVRSLQALVDRAVQQQVAALAPVAAAPVFRHRQSIMERIAEDPSHDERVPDVTITHAPAADASDDEVVSYLRQRNPEAPAMPKDLQGKSLAYCLERLWGWLDSEMRPWMDSAQSSGPELWKCVTHSFGDWISCYIDRAETPEQALFTLARVWNGGRAGSKFAKWCSGSIVWLQAALDEESLKTLTRLERGVTLTPYQRVVAIFIAPLVRYGFKNLDDVRSIVYKLQRPVAYIENKDGAEWHDELCRWHSLRLIYETIMSSALDDVTGSEGWKDVNPLWITHSLRSVVDEACKVCTAVEQSGLLKVCDQQQTHTSNPLPGASDVLFSTLTSLFNSSKSILSYKKKARGLVAAKEPPKDSSNTGSKAAPKESPKAPLVPLTPAQQSLQDRAKQGFAAHHNRDPKSVTVEEVAKSKYNIAGWAAYQDQLRNNRAQAKGQGRGKGPPRGTWHPVPQLPAPQQAAVPANLCRDFQRGACTRGAHCRFSHDAAAPAPVAAPIAPAPTRGGKGGDGKGAGSSQSDCVFWVAFGTCNNESRCVFQHRPEKRAAGGHGAPPAPPFN